MSMRILAVDPGEARIGLALSDPSGTLATPLTIIDHEARDADARRIAEVAEERGAGLIVVGEARDSENRPTPQSRKARRLAAAIREATGIPVEMWEESGSSQAASAVRRELGVSGRKRGEAVDAEAAAIILQEYLDGRRSEAKE